MSANFPKAEEEVLRHWRDIDAFQTQLRLSRGQPRFTFYDGPPFGTSPYREYLLHSVSSRNLTLIGLPTPTA